jgi:hypothetical protein
MKKALVIILTCIFIIRFTHICSGEEDASTKVIKSGLVGAGTGALAAGVTGGNAGKGALIGAGTSVIGSVLLDAITGTPSRQRGYEEEYETYDDIEEYYEEPREDATTKVLKDGLVGAGTGAIAAGVSGGKAGEGALIGAGTGIIGNALLDSITRPKSERRGRTYRRAAPRRKIIRKYDENGNLIYEEIIPVD